MAEDIVSLSVMRPEEFKRELNDPQSSFNKFNKDFIVSHGPLLERMREALPSGEAVSADDLGITMQDLRDMKGGAYNLWLKINVPDSNGKTVEVDSREFIAWQRDGADMPIDTWAQKNDIALVSQAQHIEVGDDFGEQNLNIEWQKDTRRVTGGYRAILSEKRDGAYGEIVLKGPDGKPVSNIDGLPDIFLSNDANDQIQKGQPYRGDVVIKDMHDAKGKFVEVKIFLGTQTEQASRDLEGTSFATPKAFEEYNATSRYFEVSQAQFQAWTYDVSKNPANATIPFQDWVENNWGSKERFDGIFDKMGPITKEQYERITEASAGSDMKLGTQDDRSTADVLRLLEGLKASQPQTSSGRGR